MLLQSVILNNKAILNPGSVGQPRDENNKAILNPGSVGQPRDENNKASFSVIESSETCQRAKQLINNITN